MLNKVLYHVTCIQFIFSNLSLFYLIITSLLASNQVSSAGRSFDVKFFTLIKEICRIKICTWASLTCISTMPATISLTKGSQVSILEDDVPILLNPTYLALISFRDVCCNSEVWNQANIYTCWGSTLSRSRQDFKKKSVMFYGTDYILIFLIHD